MERILNSSKRDPTNRGNPLGSYEDKVLHRISDIKHWDPRREYYRHEPFVTEPAVPKGNQLSR